LFFDLCYVQDSTGPDSDSHKESRIWDCGVNFEWK
jgi:hypothetical protein